MASVNEQLIRRDVMQIKAWLEHWQVDVASNLIPTALSLALAHAHADSALTLLDRVEDEQKERA